jgi:tetratricopeptide (TPR) repeat protein
MKKILPFLFFTFTFTLHAQVGERYTEEDIKVHAQIVRASQKKLLRKYDDAIKIYEGILEKNRNNAVALFDLSRIYLVQDKEGEAIEYGEKAIKKDSQNTWYKKSLAEIKMRFKHYDEAALMYEQLALQTKTNEQLYLNAVEAYRKADNKKATLNVFEKMESVFGISSYSAQQIIGIYLDNENYQAAIAKAKSLINFYPNDLTYLQLAAELEADFGSAEEAKRLFKAVLVLEPENSKALVFLAQGGENSDYLISLKSIIENPNVDIDAKVKAMIPIARDIKADSPDKESILTLSRTIVNLHNDEAKAYALLGDLLNNCGDPVEAAFHYNESLKRDKSIYSVWEQLMFIQFDLEDYEALAKTSNNALDYYPNQAAPYVFQGLAQVHNNNISVAKEMFSEANLIGSNSEYIVYILNMLSQTIEASEDGYEVKVLSKEDIFMLGIKPNDSSILQIREDGKYLVKMKKGS